MSASLGRKEEKFSTRFQSEGKRRDAICADGVNLGFC